MHGWSSKPDRSSRTIVDQETRRHVRAAEGAARRSACSPRVPSPTRSRISPRSSRPATSCPRRRCRSSPTSCARSQARGCPIQTDADSRYVVDSTELMAKCPSKYEGAQRRQDRHQLQVSAQVTTKACSVLADRARRHDRAARRVRRRRVVRRRRHRRQRAQEPPARHVVGLRALRLLRADRPRVGADDLRVRHARLLDQVRRGDERYVDGDLVQGHRVLGRPRRLAAVLGPRARRCSRRSRSPSTTSGTAT